VAWAQSVDFNVPSQTQLDQTVRSSFHGWMEGYPTGSGVGRDGRYGRAGVINGAQHGSRTALEIS
jgi:hypothetical protein